MRPRHIILALLIALGMSNGNIYDAFAQSTLPDIRLPEIRFTSNPTTLGIVNREYRYQASAVGRSATASVRYRLTTAPRGMTVDSMSGLVRWTTTASTTVPIRVALRAALATNANVNVTQTFSITILPESAAQLSARFATEPPPTASVGVGYVYNAFAYYGVDPRLAAPVPERLSTMRYTLIGTPKGMTIDASNGTVRWTPSASGTVQFSIQAVSTTVATAITRQNVSVRVSEARPFFLSSPPTEAFVGQPYLYNAIALLPGVSITADGTRPGDVSILPIQQRVPMNYVLVEAPSGMTVESTSGVVRWSPTTPTTAANIRVVLRANVVGGSTTQTVTQEFRLRVSTAQMLFRSQPPREARIGAAYTYSPVVSYGNLMSSTGILPNLTGGLIGIPAFVPAFTFSLVSPPQGMTIDATRGTVRWMPTASGSFTVSIRAALLSNPSLTTTQTYQVNIATAPITLNFTSNPPAVRVDIGREFVYRARAEASRPTTATIIYSLGRAPQGARIDSLTGEIRWTPSMGGEFTMEIFARLPNGTPRPAEARQAFTMYAQAVSCGVVRGVVRYTDGTVVVNGTIRALVTNVTAASVGNTPFSYAATIRNGVYSLPLGANSYILSILTGESNEVWFGGNAGNTTATVSTPDRAAQITVRCGDTVSVSAIVPRRPAARFFAVSGRVTRRLDGTAVTAMIEAVGDADPLLVNGSIIRRTVRTDAQGNYRLTQLDNRYIYTFRALPDEPRPTTATIKPPQLLPQYFDNTLNLAEARRLRLSGDITNINVALQDRPTFANAITGKVQSTTGAGIGGRIVAFMTATTASTPQYASLDVRTENVDSTGAFTLRNLTPGEYVLQAFPNSERDFASGYYAVGTTATTRWREATRITVGATSNERVTLTLASRRTGLAVAAATVSGTVSSDAGSSGESVAGASVFMLNEAGEVVGQTLTDNRGNFDAGMVEYGQYTLIVDKPGYANATAQVVAEKPAAIEKSIILQKPLSSALLTSVTENAPSVQNLGISPNPVSDMAFVQLPAFTGTARLSVINMRGEEVFSADIAAANTVMQVDMNAFANGVYIVRIAGASIRAHQRMLIAR